MHLVILWCIGPYGLNYNRVVWPWNVAMMALLPMLFLRTKDLPGPRILAIDSSVFHKVVLVFALVCPALSHVGLWNEYASFRLYAGRYRFATVYLSQRLIDTLPAEAREQVQPQAARYARKGHRVAEFAGFLVIP